jgi:hypothetical protein
MQGGEQRHLNDDRSAPNGGADGHQQCDDMRGRYQTGMGSTSEAVFDQSF